MSNNIFIKGAREHNLKNIDITIPRNSFTVITGLSGSGKSSLAFDTLYAEGQRRYVESLSAYARQFLGRMEKPNCDFIEGLSPAISIDQKGISKNPRSTAGTVTEIYDYLRLLFARIGIPHCPKCGKKISAQTIDQIYGQVIALGNGTQISILSPIVKGRKGEYGNLMNEIRKQGFVKIRINGKTMDIPDDLRLEKYKKHNIEIVVDTFTIKENIRTRIIDSLETALKTGEGQVIVVVNDNRAQSTENKNYQLPITNYQLNKQKSEVRSQKSEKNKSHDPTQTFQVCVPAVGARNPKSQFKNNSKLLKNSQSQINIADEEASYEIDELSENKKKSSSTKEFIFSENFSCVDCGISLGEITPRFFSFNSPYGACPHCDGIGETLEIEASLLIGNKENSILEKGILPKSITGSNFYHQLLKSAAEEKKIDILTPIKNLSQAEIDYLLWGDKEHKPLLTINFRNHTGGRRIVRIYFQGLIFHLDKRYEETDSEFVRYEISKYMTQNICSLCEGKRLKKESLNVLINNLSVADITNFSIKQCYEFFEKIPLTEKENIIAKDIIKTIKERLNFLINVGLDYVTLNRQASTLSGGEAQRIRLATQIGSGLTGVIYVLDEPSIGLHQKDNDKLLATLKNLRDMGNTVVVVEHDETTMRSADYVIDLGPGAGKNGGYLIFAGEAKNLETCEKSITGKFLSRKEIIEIPEKRRSPKKEFIKLSGASQYNLKNIAVNFPLGVLNCVTGVSGSGKSTLVCEILLKALRQYIYGSSETPGKYKEIKGAQHIDKVIEIDQSPIGRTPRSNPATYTKVFDIIRDLFSKLPEAKIRGYKTGRFSFNVKGGRCESCEGDGLLKIEMHFLPDVYVTCEVCGGKRYNKETLEVKYKGKNIYEVLKMCVEEALSFFQNIPKIKNILQTLYDVGLGYIEIGQPATTLSGGEAQRIKLAAELSKRETGNTLYILDEPTTGLHFADIKKLLEVLNRLVDLGNTVIVIEHNLDVIKTADYIIDLGPEGGEKGGEVIGFGTPEEIVKNKKSYTGEYLKRQLTMTNNKKQLPNNKHQLPITNK